MAKDKKEAEKVTHVTMHNTESGLTQPFTVEHAQRILDFESSPSFTGKKGWQLKDENFELINGELNRQSGKGTDKEPESGVAS